jgi:hypothetical protein
MILALTFMFLTLVVLIAGIVIMASGGKVNKKYAGKLMAARVIFQLLAILVLGILFAMR